MTMEGAKEMTERRGLQALQYWCQKATTGYHGVRVNDMSSSWRDGLAFCALIHHYRPDLIDFDSLQSENVLENNQLAFRVAEKQLGIPALLDAEDMVKYQVPDKLCIATYVSQFYQYFEGGMARMKPASAAPQNCISPASSNFNIGPPTKSPVLVRASECTACSNKVFLLERLIVGTKLYHRSCFRCCRCDSLLNPGAYALADDSEDRYECTVCPRDEGPEFKKIMLKSELSIPRRRVESFSSESSTASSDSRPSSASSKQIEAIREFAGTPGSTSGSEPELTRLKDSQRTGKADSPFLAIPNCIPVSPLAQQSTVISARFRAGNSHDIKKPEVAPKPKALIAAVRKSPNSEKGSITKDETPKDSAAVTTKSSRSPSPTKSSRDNSVCSTPDLTKRRENLRKTPTEADPLPERRLSIGSSKSSEGPPSFDERLKKLSLRSPTEPSAFQRTSSLRALPTIVPLRSDKLETDGKVRSLNSLLILPDKPKPAPRKLEENNGGYRSPYEGRRSASPYLLVHGEYSSPTASPTPLPRKKPPPDKEQKSTSEDATDTVTKTEPAESVVKTQPGDKSPGPPKPRRGIARKLQQQEKLLEEQRKTSIESSNSSNQTDYPMALNPFGECGDDDDESLLPTTESAITQPPVSTPTKTEKKDSVYPESLNPFQGDVDEGEPESVSPTHLSISSFDSTPATSIQNDSLNPFFDASRTPSLKKSPKKRAAPLPPSHPSNASLVSVNSGTSGTNSPSVTRNSSNVSRNRVTPAAAPSPSVAPPIMTEARKKKRPAPSVPVPMKRELQAVSLKAIQAEMRTIEKRLVELETQGKNIELSLRQLPPPSESVDETDSNAPQEEALMMQLFELVNEKNTLYRRQAELMYIKRYQRLEEDQIELEYQIRVLISKPASQKTPEDDAREAELIQKLVEIVELRNEIIDAQEIDRQRLTREDEDIEAQRLRMTSRASGTTSCEPAESTKGDKKKKKKKDKNKNKDKESKDPEESSKKTLKKLFKEKYKTLKQGAVLKKT